MQLRNSADSYGAAVKVLHWLTVALVLFAWMLGTFGDVLPRGAARANGLVVHISLGLSVLAVTILRLVWRNLDPPPPLEPAPFGGWAEFAAKGAHWTLYALLLIVPLLGMAVQFSRGNALPLFGLFEIASPLARDRDLAHSIVELHGTLADVLVILAAVHTVAALAHHWLLRDRTLLRMLPGARG
jgi:cytochrome b561